MAENSIEIGLQTPIAAASALKKAGYGVTSGGKPVNVSETDDKEKELTDGEGKIHTKKWDRCVKKVKASGKSEESAYKICSSSVKNAGVQSDHQQKTGKQYVANRKESETNEGDTMFDVFPELNAQVTQDGGEIKDIKVNQKPIEKAEKPNETWPKKVARDKQEENRKSNKKPIMEKSKGDVISKKEVLEAIQSGGSPAPAPARPAPDAPTTTPSKPGQKPKKDNPFRPKPGPNPNPKGALPSWLKADKLGIGKNQPVSEELSGDLQEALNYIKKII